MHKTKSFDDVITMHNFLEYSGNYSQRLRSFFEYYRNKTAVNFFCSSYIVDNHTTNPFVFNENNMSER